VETVVVLVDGQPAAIGAFGEHRPDVATERRGGEFCGWSAQIDLRGKTGSPVAITAVVLTRAGLVERLNEVILFADRQPKRGDSECGWVTGSQSGMLALPTVVRIEGWMLPPTIPARIEIRVDEAPVGLARPFVAPQRAPLTTLQRRWTPLAGFECDVDLSGREPGDQVRIEAVVTALDQTETKLAPLEVEVTEPLATSSVTATVGLLREQIEAIARSRVRTSPDVISLLVVTHQLDLGGGQLYMLELLRHVLLELDVACVVVSMTDGVLREKLEELGAFVHVCGRPSLESPERYETQLVELAELAAEHGCNVAFVNSMMSGFGADLTRRLAIPTVWAIHESYSLDGFFVAGYGQDGIHPYIRGRVSDALAVSAAVVFEAEATRELYEEHGDTRRFITIPYGIPIAEVDAYLAKADRDALRSAHGFAPEDVVVLCMGTYEPRKSQGALALAFAELADEFPNAVLALVGEVENPYAKAVRELVESLGLGDRIKLVPVVEDTYAWYAMADVFVTVSDVESLPRSVLEAMAFGVPVLAAEVFGLPELIEDGVSGLLVAPRDLSAWIGGLRRVLAATPTERSGLGSGGSDLVRSRHDSSHYAAAYRQLFRGLLDDARALPGELLRR
jgi:glycosyltransferase involved in cell wall biosynthesis